MGADTRVTLIPRFALKVNARVKPALELPDGTVLRFDSPRPHRRLRVFRRAADGPLRAGTGGCRARVRASVCENDTPVCRSLVLAL